ncbi:MAG: amino acid permease [Alteraurantiacibacter sp.]
MDKLERPFGLWTATAMVVGGMIGGGIFALPSSLAPYGWTGLIAWLFAGAGALLIAWVITALTARRPHEPSIITNSGDILGLLPGRLMAWIYWLTIVTSLPVLGMTATAYLLHLVPDAPHGAWPQVIGGTVILLALAALNLRGVREAGVFQVVTTVLKLLPLVLVVAITAWLALAEPVAFTQSASLPFTATQLTPALGLVFFAMLNLENASIVAERVRDPARNVARATVLGIIGVLVVYVTVSTGIVATVPADELAASSAPVALFVSRNLGPWAGDAVALFAAISAVGCLNVLVLMLGEVPLGMVRDGQLPPWMAPLNARGVSARPLLAGVALALVLMLGSVTGMGGRVLEFMLLLTTASSIWFYIGIAAAAWMVNLLRPVAVLAILFCLWVLYGTGLEAGVLGLVLMLAGIPLHYLIGAHAKPRGTAPAA